MKAVDTRVEIPQADIRPLAELRTSGLLWLINRVVFHPRGFAVALHATDAGEVVGWQLLGDGGEVWSFSEEADEASFLVAEETLKRARP